MVQNKKQTSCKPKFAEVIIGDKEAKEMYEAPNPRPRRNPYLKLNCLNDVILISVPLCDWHPIFLVKSWMCLGTVLSLRS